MSNCILTNNSNQNDVIAVIPAFSGGLRGGSVTDSTFDANAAWSSKLRIFGNGEGLVHFNVSRSTFSNNVSSQCGSAITTHGDTFVTVRDTTIFNNQKTNGCQMGGAAIDNGGHLVVLNSTLSGNSVVQAPTQATGSPGGAISANRFGGTGSTLIVNSTIVNNSAWDRAGGVFNGSMTDSLRILNSIIAGNTAPLNNDIDFAEGTAISLGHNLIGDLGSAPLTAVTGDQFGTSKSPIDPMLGPLANNGGPTLTHDLLVGSTAIDAGDSCVTQTPGCLVTPITTDQRGYSRIVEGGTLGTPAVDIGAVELLAPSAANVSVSGRVTDQSGHGLARATLILQSPSGEIQVVVTNPFGYFSFENVEVGRTYLIDIKHKRHSFTSRTIQVQDEITGLEFAPEKQ